MVAIRLSALVGEDRRLVIDLPPDTPLGPVELVIRSAESPVNPAREAARAKLMAAGILVRPEDMGIPDDLQPLPLEERLRIGKMPPGVRPSEELVDEDRGEW